MTDCMDLFYKMEGKDMYVEKVLTGSVVAAPYYQEGSPGIPPINPIRDNSSYIPYIGNPFRPKPIFWMPFFEEGKI